MKNQLFSIVECHEELDTLTKYCRPEMFEELAAARPKLKICLANIWTAMGRKTAMLMSRYTNVYTDTGALYFDNAKEFYTQMLTRMFR